MAVRAPIFGSSENKASCLLISFTGNIGSGKSMAAQLFSERGATIIDADVLARRAVELGTRAYLKIVELMGWFSTRRR